ncbi:MAG: hypothetical protein NC388_00800 [Clostridium sp.]|nr:hypothetical protein [Clostridium sp.]
MNQKRKYTAPVIERHNVEVETMLALSIIGGTDAGQNGEVLGSDEKNWDIWAE